MHIISGTVRKAAYTKDLQDGTKLFIVELSEKIRDKQSGADVYTNYSVALFAKSPAVDCTTLKAGFKGVVT